MNSGLLPPGTQSEVYLTINSINSQLADNEVSDSVTLSFVVTGMLTYSDWGSGPVSLSAGESTSFDVAILSLFDSGSPTSRVIVEIGGNSAPESLPHHPVVTCRVPVSPADASATIVHDWLTV